MMYLWCVVQVRFISDFGAIFSWYLFGSYYGYITSSWIAGGVAVFGILADFIRTFVYDPFYTFPKPMDTGEMILYFVMAIAGDIKADMVMWFNPISTGGIFLIILVAELLQVNVMFDSFRENPNIPRRVWTEPHFEGVRKEIRKFSSAFSKWLCIVLLLETLLACAVPGYITLEHGTQPPSWFKLWFNVILQIAMLPPAVFYWVFVMSPELSEETLQILAGNDAGHQESAGELPSEGRI